MQECCPDSKPRFEATLPNYKLVFLGWSRKWRGGVASIKHFRGEKVRGAGYEVSDRDLRRLDAREGYPGGVHRLKVTVFTEDGDPVPVVTYIKAARLEEVKPSAEYLSLIQRGYRDWEIT